MPTVGICALNLAIPTPQRAGQKNIDNLEGKVTKLCQFSVAFLHDKNATQGCIGEILFYFNTL
ncbi:hypothetical protein GCM10011498_16580 [Amylibacter cionae]|uniref:Uncharacterized protein n=1 Tax=Neptunicoccus cionae TaxID=2035344 RepID=A0A916QX48_9RHOB|nr:hypothetical protein GCM10011498_16580 [Amylibacter cionae]